VKIPIDKTYKIYYPKYIKEIINMKEIEQTCFIELEDEPFVIEVILYKDGTSERKIFDEGGQQI
jgi:hypothetical protein